ncbi:MAG: YbjN domain-containing protein [Geminicoccaceae bacterium]|nr:YbjN domain-containing protein [Geminicoccaceae bacterium]
MSSLQSEFHENVANPLDRVEKLADNQEWPYHRHSDEELAAEIDGQWCHYRLWFSWHPEIGVMHLSCALDMKVPAKKRAEFFELLSIANTKLWLGHFELWQEEQLPIFRHACLFRESSGASEGLLSDLVDIAVNECDRFYPAFQFMFWGGRKAEEAIMAALLETEGEA